MHSFDLHVYFVYVTALGSYKAICESTLQSPLHNAKKAVCNSAATINTALLLLFSNATDLARESLKDPSRHDDG